MVFDGTDDAHGDAAVMDSLWSFVVTINKCDDQPWVLNGMMKYSSSCLTVAEW